MIGLDTNVLARYYVDDKADAEADRQRMAARRLIESGQPLMVCKTVILELVWVMRGYYGLRQPKRFWFFDTCSGCRTSPSKTVARWNGRCRTATRGSISGYQRRTCCATHTQRFRAPRP
jgi:hypothetical protein